MLDMKLYERARKLGARSPIRKELVQQVEALLLGRRLSQMGQLLKKRAPHLKELVDIEFDDLLGQGRLRNPSIVRGLFGIRRFCENCGVDCTVSDNQLCSDACRRLHLGRKTTEVRANETAEQLRERARKSTLKKTELYGEGHWLIGEKISASKATRTVEDIKSASAKQAATLLKRYGGTSVYAIPGMREHLAKAHRASIPQMLATKEKTMLERYGVRHQAHLHDVQQNINKFKRKEIRLGGKIFSYQGYEGHLLKHLHLKGYRLKTQLSGISYCDANGVERVYFPDIMAVRDERILLIEVKSTYTFGWTKSTCPEKFFAGTDWAKRNNAIYIIAVVAPGKGKMALFYNPKNLQDLKTNKAQYSTISTE